MGGQIVDGMEKKYYGSPWAHQLFGFWNFYRKKKKSSTWINL